MYAERGKTAVWPGLAGDARQCDCEHRRARVRLASPRGPRAVKLSERQMLTHGLSPDVTFRAVSVVRMILNVRASKCF